MWPRGGGSMKGSEVCPGGVCVLNVYTSCVDADGP